MQGTHYVRFRENQRKSLLWDWETREQKGVGRMTRVFGARITISNRTRDELKIRVSIRLSGCVFAYERGQKATLSRCMSV